MRALAFLAVAASSTLAAADDKPATPVPDTGFAGDGTRKVRLEIEDCRPNDPSLTKEQLLTEGAEHYERGEQLYIQGDYRGSVRELVASYCNYPFYSILKDIGQAYERALEYELAIAYLRKYYESIPADAKRLSECSPDPQDDIKNIQSRIQVLQDLRASVLIDTNVPDAQIVLETDGKKAAEAIAGHPMEVLGAKKYTVRVTAKGYRDHVEEIEPIIGKPKSVYVKLDPEQGKLRVHAPVDAKLYLDDNFLGAGSVAIPLDVKTYTLRVQEDNHEEWKHEVSIVAGQENNVIVEPEPLPQQGRRQLLLYAGVAGAGVGATFGQVFNDQSSGLGLVIGASAALAGVYYYGERNIALGTSSLTITSSLVGVVAGADSGLLFNKSSGADSATLAARFAAGGALAGAGIGYYIGDRTHITPGDAALVNSGALWGGVAGHLFAAAFQGGQTLTGGLGLSGLAMGTTGGVLLARYYTVSRKHAALIDVGGLVGMIVGVAADNLIFNQTGGTVTGNGNAQTAAEQERTADFALGGLATGLIVAGVLTRTMDVPQLPGTATVGHALGADGKQVTTFGIGGSF